MTEKLASTIIPFYDKHYVVEDPASGGRTIWLAQRDS